MRSTAVQQRGERNRQDTEVIRENEKKRNESCVDASLMHLSVENTSVLYSFYYIKIRDSKFISFDC